MIGKIVIRPIFINSLLANASKFHFNGTVTDIVICILHQRDSSKRWRKYFCSCMKAIFFKYTSFEEEKCISYPLKTQTLNQFSSKMDSSQIEPSLIQSTRVNSYPDNSDLRLIRMYPRPPFCENQRNIIGLIRISHYSYYFIRSPAIRIRRIQL